MKLDMQKKIGLMVGFIVVATAIVMFLKQSTVAHDETILTIGIAADYAPFVSINERGEYEGFDIDIAHAIAQKMGKTLVLKDVGSMAPLFIALDQGSIDAIMWGISITKDRLEKVDFVHYQGQVTKSFPLLFWKNIPEGVQGFADMRSMRVCAEPASAQSALLCKYEDIITVISTEKVDDAFLMVQQQKVDAAFLDPAIAKKFCAKYLECKILDIPLATEDQVYGMGIPVKKGNTHMVEQIQVAINALRNERFITQCEQKWGIA